MGVVFQVVCAVLIVLAVLFYLYRNKKSPATKGQLALAVFQIALCGYFFSLCLSDVLDIRVNFSAVRVVLDCFYDLAFLMLTTYTLFFNDRENDNWFRAVIWSGILLIAVQCFVYPYGAESEALRIIEALEGAAVFGLLIVFSMRPREAAFGQKCLAAIILMELADAIVNVIVPIASVTQDFQAIDIILNYQALFMRTVFFASLALAYRIWLDRRGISTGRR